MNDSPFVFIFIVVLAVFSVIGITGVILDYRNFQDVVKECAEKGRIQDSKTRIICSVEPS